MFYVRTQCEAAAHHLTAVCVFLGASSRSQVCDSLLIAIVTTLSSRRPTWDPATWTHWNRVERWLQGARRGKGDAGQRVLAAR